MAQPTIYERDTSFQDFQSTHPSTPLPGNLVDQEFDAITASLEEFGANLALIQRDDGEVANRTVGYDQLKSEVVIGFNEPTPWATATSYAASDAVFVGASIYRAVSAHTSGATFNTDLAAGKWEELFDFSVFLSATAGVNWIDDGWALGVQHAVNDGLGHNGASYRCTAAHMATNDTEPGVGADWEDYWVIIAAQGGVGAAGAAATLTIGNVNTGAAGSEATVVNSGTENAAVLDITIPRGHDGVDGIDGVDGAAATIAVGTVATGAPGTDVIVTNVGTAAAAIFDITIPRGDTGASGAGSGDMLAATYDPTNIGASAFARANHTGTQAASTISDFSTAADARVAAAVGVSVQGYSANLDEYAAVNPTAAGLALLDDADAAAQRTTMGLGTSAVKNTGTSGDAVPLLNAANTWDDIQTFSTAASGTAPVRVVSSDAGASQGPFVDLARTSASPAASDALGGVRFRGMDSGGNETLYTQFRSRIIDPTDGSEDGALEFVVAVGGVNTQGASLADGFVVGAATGSYQGTGTVNASDYYRNGTALSSTLFGVAVGTASGNLKTLNADGGFTLDASTTPTVNMGIVFGGTWKAANKQVATSTGLLTGTYATQVLRWEGEGHNSSGATESGLPLFLEGKKTNYLTSTTEGQILGTYTTIYGGRLGDHAAHLFDARKVFDGTYSGSVLGIEGSVQKVNASGTTTQHVQCYMGWGMYNPGGGLNFAPDGMLGFAVEPRVGDTFAAFAGVERDDLSGTPAFNWVVVGSDNRNNANIFGGMTGAAHASGPGRFHASTSASFPGFAFVGDENTGVGSPAADQVGLYTNGTARMWATTTNINTSVAPRIFNGTAIPAGGQNGLGYLATSATNFGVFFGSGAPTLSAAKGSLYLRSDGTTTNNRAYINTDGGTTWTALTTAA